MNHPPGSRQQSCTVAIIGAGLAGIAVGVELAQAGINDFLILDRATEVGGVWRDNQYPGCRCDIPSSLYSYSFAPKHDWSDRFATQPEIWSYLHDCVQNFNLGDRLRLSCGVSQASWQPQTGSWAITTSAGQIEARMIVVATGSLNEPALPKIDGLDSFAGPVFHSSRWPTDFDPVGKRISVVGTGASAVQLVPEIAPAATSVTVFQRTPPWILPRGDKRLPGWLRHLYGSVPGVHRASRTWQFLTREAVAGSFADSGRMLDLIERAGQRHLANQIKDAELRLQLTPHYRVGCKRILMSDDWYPTLARENVSLIARPPDRADRSGLLTGTQHHRADAIVLATGFQVTRLPFLAAIRGTAGESLAATWGATRPSAYLGSTVSGFPNMVLISGPNTGLANSSMILMIESQARYARMIAAYLAGHPGVAFDVRREVQERYTDDIERRIANSVWATGGCQSWYQDARGRVTTMWPGRASRFRALTRDLNLGDYQISRPNSIDVPQPARQFLP